MRLSVYKETDKDFNDIYEDEKEVKEVILKVGNTSLVISEHQLGLPLDKTHVTLTIHGDSVYSIDFDDFIQNSVS